MNPATNPVRFAYKSYLYDTLRPTTAQCQAYVDASRRRRGAQLRCVSKPQHETSTQSGSDCATSDLGEPQCHGHPRCPCEYERSSRCHCLSLHRDTFGHCRQKGSASRRMRGLLRSSNRSQEYPEASQKSELLCVRSVDTDTSLVEHQRAESTVRSCPTTRLRIIPVDSAPGYYHVRSRDLTEVRPPHTASRQPAASICPGTPVRVAHSQTNRGPEGV